MLFRLSIVVLILIPMLAIGIPTLVFDDALPAGISDEQASRLKTQASASSKSWRLFALHVKEIRSTGPAPDDFEGMVIWRSAFGVPVGTFTLVQNSSTFVLSPARIALLWCGLLGLGAWALSFAVWSFRRMQNIQH